MTQTRLRSAGALLLLGLVVLFTFSGLLSADQVPAYRDLLFFVLPFKSFLGEHLRRGEIPLWNPYIYMGTPFLASLQSGVFYPPSALFLLSWPGWSPKGEIRGDGAGSTSCCPAQNRSGVRKRSLGGSSCACHQDEGSVFGHS